MFFYIVGSVSDSKAPIASVIDNSAIERLPGLRDNVDMCITNRKRDDRFHLTDAHLGDGDATVCFLVFETLVYHFESSNMVPKLSPWSMKLQS